MKILLNTLLSLVVLMAVSCKKHSKQPAVKKASQPVVTSQPSSEKEGETAAESEMPPAASVEDYLPFGVPGQNNITVSSSSDSGNDSPVGSETPATYTTAEPVKPVQQETESRPGIITEVQNAVDGMAGGAAFRAGQRAKSKIRNINQQHNRQLERALNQ